MALFDKFLPASAAVLLSAGVVGAQAAKPVCTAEQAKGGLARVAFTIEQARAAAGTPAANATLSTAVKQLEAASNEDATTRSLFLGQTLALWLGQPNMTVSPKRSALGFTQNGEATIDLVSNIDSLFKVVETAQPACAELTTMYRGGLPGYVNLANAAINALNADKLDSAEYYGQQAYRLFPASPYASMVLGSVASKRNDNAKAVEYWTASAAAAAKDTLYRDVQRQVLGNVGIIMLSNADAASGTDRVTAARRAADAYAQMMSIPGTKGSSLTAGRQNYQRALLLAGDTATFVSSYAPMLANPSGYDYQDLVSTAANVYRANRLADAAKLFEASVAQNPYYRDGLYNLGLTYLGLEQYDKVSPIVKRLVAIDPSNPEDYELAARAYLAQAKAAQAAKKTPVVAAYNDSAMVWYNTGNKLPVQVVFTEFSTTENQVTLGGRVLDRRDKIDAVSETPTPAPAAKGARARPAAAPAKPAAPSLAPTAVTVKLEALDKSGAVVGTQTVTTEALSPGQSGRFTATINAPNATGYRYTVGG